MSNEVYGLLPVNRRRVVVIHSRLDYASTYASFPPIGAVGTIVSGLDEFDEYDIEFDDYPCPCLFETSWITHKSMIVFIDETKSFFEQYEKEIRRSIVKAVAVPYSML